MKDACIDEKPNEELITLSNFHSRENSFIPVSHLPNEILTSIFILLASDYYHFQLIDPDDQSVPRWVNVSYICRHWRSVALDCPTLWSYIFMASRRWTEELLARSKEVSLKIFADIHASTPPRVFEPVADHVERIEELHLYLPFGNNNFQFLSRFLSTPGPRLRHLEIFGLQLPLESPLLPFKGCAPALHTLQLSSCWAPWYSFPLSSLTTLRLRYVDPSFQLQMTELLATLGRMPSLVHLELSNALAGDRHFLSSRAFSVTPKTNLSRLSYVEVAAPLSAIVAFMSCVDIPSTARICLFLESEHSLTPLNEFNQFLSCLARFSTPAVPIIRSLVILNDSGCMELIFSASERLFSDLHEIKSGCLLEVTFRSSSVMILEDNRIISDICHAMPLKNIRNLHIHCPPLSLDFWQSMWSQLPNLRYMMLSGGKIPNIASLLFLSPDASARNLHAGQGPTRVLVPLLEELELRDMFVTLKYPSAPQDASRCDLQPLINALATRTEAQCKLTMTECCIQRRGGTKLRLVDCNSSWEKGQFSVSTNEYDLPSDSDIFE